MKTIKLDELTGMIEPGKKHPVLINTLPNDEFQKAHIPGSINIPADQIAQKVSGLCSKNDWIVVYCASPTCDASHKAGQTLERLGFKNVYRFEGGIEEWQRQNHYINTEGQQPRAEMMQKKTTKAA